MGKELIVKIEVLNNTYMHLGYVFEMNAQITIIAI